MTKKIYNVGIAAYIVLLAFSVIFLRERTIFADAAFILFNIAKSRSFAIQVYRFADVSNQLFPVLAAKTGASLTTLMLSYSVGYIIYYLVCYIICGSILRKYEYALILLLLNTLFISDSYYWIVSQLPLGLALLTVTLAFAESNYLTSNPYVKGAVIAAATITIAFFHPLLIFAVAFITLFITNDKTTFRSAKWGYFFTAFYIVLIIIKLVAFQTAYEHSSLSGLKNFIRFFPNYISIYSNNRFLAVCLHKYHWMVLSFIAIIIYYIATKKLQKLLLFFCFFTGYLLLINICFAGSDTPLFYIESLYTTLAIFIGFPLVFDIMPASSSKMMISVFIVIILTGSFRIYASSAKFTARLQYERQLLQQYGGRKAVVNSAKTDTALLQMLWATPYEFWLLSTAEQGKTASIIIDDHPKRLDWAGGVTKSLIVNWNVYPYSDLPKKYFKFADTTTGYIIDP